jgi:hypothetical protein
MTPETALFSVFFDHTHAQCSKRDPYGPNASVDFPANAITYRMQRWGPEQ